MFKKIKIKSKKGDIRQIYFCGIPLLEYQKCEGKKIYRALWNNSVPTDETKQTIYLKLNKFDEGAKKCFEYWLQVASILDAAIIILCDKTDITQRILSETLFNSSIIRIIKSQRKIFKKFVDKLKFDPWWYNAAYAHLTTFNHAINNNIQNYWNIDADDTIFMIEPEKLANSMLEIEQYADNNDISLFSLDMHHSNSNSFHWSYGITYTRDPQKILEEFFKKDNFDKWKKYQNDNVICKSPALNLDWYSTFIQANKRLKIKTFYINNLYFLHYSFPLLRPALSLSLFSDNKITYPIFKQVFEINNVMISYVPIASDDIKFEFDEINIDSSKEYMANYWVGKNERLNAAQYLFSIYPEEHSNFMCS